MLADTAVHLLLKCKGLDIHYASRIWLFIFYIRNGGWIYLLQVVVDCPSYLETTDHPIVESVCWSYCPSSSSVLRSGYKLQVILDCPSIFSSSSAQATAVHLLCNYMNYPSILEICLLILLSIFYWSVRVWIFIMLVGFDCPSSTLEMKAGYIYCKL